MNLFITHESALEYWFGNFVRRNPPQRWLAALPSSPLGDIRVDPEDFQHIGIHDQPLHLMVADASQRTRQRSVISHVWSGPIPSGAFEPVRNGIWVSSPELCFCQMAATLPFPQTVELGYQLCARFRINGFLDTLEQCKPLTSAKALLSFAERVDYRGAKKARVAARHVLDDTESPREIAAAMLLTLPKCHGGYGFGGAKANMTITVPNPGFWQRKLVYRGDLVWPEKRLVLEYDSDMFHAGPERISADAERRNNLMDDGWRVITLTRAQLDSPAKMDAVAAQIARVLGVRNAYQAKHTPALRAELRRQLLAASGTR